MAPFRFRPKIRRQLNEMTGAAIAGLRNALSHVRRGFFVQPTSPALRDAVLDPDKLRSLYYNTDPNISYGAFLAKPIIDSTADFIGMPLFSVQDEIVDNEINKWVSQVWKKALWEMYRNCLRETNTWVRVRMPMPNNPLIAEDELMIPELEVYDTDRVTPYYSPTNSQVLERVEILTRIFVEDEPFDPTRIYATGALAHGREHEIIEIITPKYFSYYDVTTGQLWEDLTTENTWGFVPMVEAYNDYDTALHGGTSEIETVYPFLKALHDLFLQSQSTHSYNANPKLKFKLSDVNGFLVNNFPESFVDGKFSGKLTWKDTDIFLMEDQDDAAFITADLKTNDSVQLMNFVLDCICMASQVPDYILFRPKQREVLNSADFFRFKAKVHRKRENFEDYLQQIMRMALKVAKNAPKRATVTWPELEPQDLITKAQALNFTVTAAEVLNRAKVISRPTYRSIVRPYIPSMKTDAEEESSAQQEAQQEADQQLQQEQQLSLLTGTPVNKNGNGGGPNSATAKRVRAAIPAALPLSVTPSQPGE